MRRRIAIFGNAAGGKSTLARELSMRLGIERHSLDDVQWRAGWQPAPLEEVARHHRAWLERDAWIIDGWGSWDLIEERVRRADTIILIDLPVIVHVWRALRRLVQARRGRSEEWPPAGCEPRGITLRLLRVMWLVHARWRPLLRETIAAEGRDGSLVWLRSQRAVEAWMASTGAR